MKYFALCFFLLVHICSGCDYTNDNPVDEMNCTGFECLKNYVEKDDGAFEWKDTGKRLNGTTFDTGVKWTGYVLNVTSQKWLTPEDFESPTGHVWWHVAIVIVPENVNDFTNGFMWITGGNNDAADPVPKNSDEEMIAITVGAARMGVVCVYLGQVPNQHIVFSADPQKVKREEDATIAFTWSQFVDDPTRTEWPLRLPMTKAAVKTMDAVTEFMKSDASPLKMNLEKFAVAGASKRGWTTWTTGAVDNERVIAIVPIVMDELNFVKNIHHHYRAYGGWSWALKDYFDRNFTACLDHPNTQLLMDIVDPLNYADRLTMPKLVVNSGMDEFFLPDDTSYWWNKMPGPKRFLMEPNTEHSQATGILELVPDFATFVSAVFQKREIPSFNWTIDRENTGDIDVYVPPAPKGLILDQVDMWHATTCNSERRDFRILTKGWGGRNGTFECLPCGIEVKGLCTNLRVFWTKEKLEETSPGTGMYKAHRDPPSDGRWTAFFVDVQYKPDNNQSDIGMRRKLEWPFLPKGDFEFTSEVSIVPNTFPFEDCQDAACVGTLV